jgi:hypothetical protein
MILTALQVSVMFGIAASLVIVFRRLEEIRQHQVSTLTLVYRLIDRRGQGTFWK